MKSFLFIGYIRIASLLPLPVLHFFGYLVGNSMYIFPGKVRKVSKINIDHCFARETAAWRQNLLRKSLIELGKCLFELGPTWCWPMAQLNKKILQTEGMDEMLACMNKGRGVIIATPHLGNWELSGLVGSERFPFTILYKAAKISGIGEFLRQARSRAGATLADITQGGLKQVISALRRGEAIGLLPDQEPREASAAVFAPFFGVPAMTMTLFQKLARKTDAVIFFATMQRLPKGRGYKLILRQVDAGLDAADPVEAATALNRELEKTIRACPEQYLWAYRRFKQQPDGGSSIYDG